MNTRYYISFELNGRTHSFYGDSSYPSEYLIKKDEVDLQIVIDNVFDFIKSYMEQMSLSGKVNPHTVHYRYEILKD